MKVCILIFVTCFIGCTPNNIPASHLKLENILLSPNHILPDSSIAFFATITSNVNFQEWSRKTDGLGPFIYCPFDNDFSLIFKYNTASYVNGIITDTPIYVHDRYEYKVGLLLKKPNKLTNQEEEIKIGELLQLVKKSRCISCMVVIPYYFHVKQTYYSDTFCIPIDSIRKCLAGIDPPLK